MNQFTECEVSKRLALNPGLLTPIQLGTYYMLRFMGDIMILRSILLEATIWTEISRHINIDKFKAEPHIAPGEVEIRAPYSPND